MRYRGKARGNGTRTAAAALLLFVPHLSLFGTGCADSADRAREVFRAEEIVEGDLLLNTDLDEPDGAEAGARCVAHSFDAELIPWLESRIESLPAFKSEGYVAPGAAEVQHFRDALGHVLAGDYCAAAAAASGAGYELLTIHDTGWNAKTLLLLQPEPGADYGRGLYLVRTGAGRDLVLEAPHPLYDLRSALVAAEVFQAAGGRALAVAGAHRCANAMPAGCDGTTSVCNDDDWGPYRESDMAHVDDSFFQVFHEVLSTEQPSTVTVQVHGMASGDDDPEFSAGDGTETDNPDEWHLPNLLAADLGQRIAAAGSTKPGNSCNREGDENVNCGKTNMQGRFSNGVEAGKICITEAASGTGAFVHLELSKELRHPDINLGPRLVIDSILEVVPAY